MKKLVLILIMVCLLPLSVQAADFIFDKGVTWGMSQKAVLKIEKKAGSKVKNKSADKAEVNANYREHKDVRVIYFFTNDKLSGVEYTIRYATTVSNAQLYYDDYLKVVGDLTDSYGKPDQEGLNWKISDTALKSGFEDQNKTGLAVSLGYLDARAVWELEDNMTITVDLFSPENLKAAIKVSYKKL